MKKRLEKKREKYLEIVKMLLEGLEEDERSLRMKEFIQHGKITTYEHCLRVAVMSYKIHKLFRTKADERKLIRGAFLHDYFLYDWHHKKDKVRSIKDFFALHGFTHPEVAAENAKRDFDIDETEEHIIRSHMWPLTFTKIPRCREAVIVCTADKLTSLYESVFRFGGVRERRTGDLAVETVE